MDGYELVGVSPWMGFQFLMESGLTVGLGPDLCRLEVWFKFCGLELGYVMSWA